VEIVVHGEVVAAGDDDLLGMRGTAVLALASDFVSDGP
jgi:hypothetical protein